jgi:uncharacterized protein
MAAGTIGWHDLTVPDAARVRDFYGAVLGWEHQPLDMGGYDDYVMIPAGSADGVAGVCHARGSNANLPPVWLVYFVVEDLEPSLQECVRRGGEQVTPVRNAGGGRFCVIRDPAGALSALYQAPPPAAT